MAEQEQLYPSVTREIAEQRKSLAPQPAEAFKAFSRSVFAEGALPAKTKQLIAVAMAHVTQCPYCIRGHTHSAFQQGATAEEIMEAIWVAAEMRAGAWHLIRSHACRAKKADHHEQDRNFLKQQERTMPSYTYLIIGGGMTADAAVHGIREVDRSGSIGLLSAEGHPPYDRPPLSKKIWKGKPLESIWRHTESQGVSLHLGRTARHLDPQNKRVTDDQGTIYDYGKLLLATGGTPRRLPFGGEHIIYFRTLDDYYHLRALTATGQHFAVIGGGFIGSEVAAALALNGKSVAMAFPEAGIGARMFPPDLATFLNDFYRQKGVEVLAGQRVDGLETCCGRTVLRVQSDQEQTRRELVIDGVVAGIGIQPNVELAQAVGLEVDNGIRVDASLRTSHPDIYAAGDVANFYNPALDRRLRVEHEDNANMMGRLAGQAMAGRAVNYDHLPFFYSDLFELGYEAVGELDSRLETVADWKEPHQKGVVYYLRDGRVRGVLLWNVWEQVDAARKLIAEPGPFRPESLKGRLPT